MKREDVDFELRGWEPFTAIKVVKITESATFMEVDLGARPEDILKAGIAIADSALDGCWGGHDNRYWVRTSYGGDEVLWEDG